MSFTVRVRDVLMADIAKAKGYYLRQSSANYRWPRREHMSKESPAQMFSSTSTLVFASTAVDSTHRTQRSGHHSPPGT